MELKSVISDRQYYSYNDLFERHKKEGDFEVVKKATFIEGVANRFQPQNNDWVFEMDGKEHVLNSCGHLNFQMSKVKEGSFVTAIYKGKAKVEQGPMKGKEAHQWDVKYALNPDYVAAPKKVQEVETDSDDVPF